MADREKPRRGRRSYLADFQQTAGGDYVYTGQLHHFEAGALSRKKALALLWVWTVLLSAAVIAAGCLPAAGMMNCFYVLLPYMGALLAAGSLVWLMCRLSAGGDPLRDYVYKATVAQFKGRSILAAVLGGCTLVGDIVFLILNGPGDQLAGTVAFLVCMALYLCAALAWERTASLLKWSK